MKSQTGGGKCIYNHILKNISSGLYVIVILLCIITEWLAIGGKKPEYDV